MQQNSELLCSGHYKLAQRDRDVGSSDAEAVPGETAGVGLGGLAHVEGLVGEGLVRGERLADLLLGHAGQECTDQTAEQRVCGA